MDLLNDFFAEMVTYNGDIHFQNQDKSTANKHIANESILLVFLSLFKAHSVLTEKKYKKSAIGKVLLKRPYILENIVDSFKGKENGYFVRVPIIELLRNPTDSSNGV